MTYVKISPKMVNPRHIGGDAEENEHKKVHLIKGTLTLRVGTVWCLDVRYRPAVGTARNKSQRINGRNGDV